MLTEAKAKFACLTTYILLGIMLVIMLLWNVDRDDGNTWFIFIVQSLPICILLPSLIQGNRRTFSWLCFIILLYFVLAVMNAMQSLADTLDYLYLGLTVCVFISSMMASRWLRNTVS